MMRVKSSERMCDRMAVSAQVVNKAKSSRTSITLDSVVKEKAGAFFEDLGMDMSTGVNIILKNMIRTGKFPVSLDLYSPPKRIADLTPEEKAVRASQAVQNRDTTPQIREQRGYTVSFDSESGRPVRIYQDGRRELCE